MSLCWSLLGSCSQRLGRYANFGIRTAAARPSIDTRRLSSGAGMTLQWLVASYTSYLDECEIHWGSSWSSASVCSRPDAAARYTLVERCAASQFDRVFWVCRLVSLLVGTYSQQAHSRSSLPGSSRWSGGSYSQSQGVPLSRDAHKLWQNAYRCS